eukprot:247817-Pelagomonas_calceolata.AAC.4
MVQLAHAFSPHGHAGIMWGKIRAALLTKAHETDSHAFRKVWVELDLCSIIRQRHSKGWTASEVLAELLVDGGFAKWWPGDLRCC